MLEKIIKQIEKDLKNKGYRENDNIDNATKNDIIERSDLKKALDYRFADCSEIYIEEVHKLSKYSEIRDVIEKYLETNNILIVTDDYSDQQEEDEQDSKIDAVSVKPKGHTNRSSDILAQYFQEINRVPLLTSEEEVEIFTEKNKIVEGMNSIAENVLRKIINELNIDINSVPKSCLKEIQDFYKNHAETLDRIKIINSRIKEYENINSSEQNKYLKQEKHRLTSYYKQNEVEAANKVCKKLVEEKNNGNANIPDSCINLIKEYESLSEKYQKIRDRIVNANLRLVVSVASKYSSKEEKVMSFSDLIQEGNFGLMKAVERFDVTKGYKFSTYATWWIRQSVTRSKADCDRTIRIPVHMVESINKLFRLKYMLTQELNREPSNKELAEALNISVEKVEDILKLGQEPASLYATVGEDDDSRLMDFIPDEAYNVEEDADQNELRRVIMKTLDSLSDREKRIMILRFGLDGKDPRTLQEVGQEFGVTRERIRQIEAKALRRLRHPSRGKKLKDFVK